MTGWHTRFLLLILLPAATTSSAANNGINGTAWFDFKAFYYADYLADGLPAGSRTITVGCGEPVNFNWDVPFPCNLVQVQQVLPLGEQLLIVLLGKLNSQAG